MSSNHLTATPRETRIAILRNRSPLDRDGVRQLARSALGARGAVAQEVVIGVIKTATGTASITQSAS